MLVMWRWISSSGSVFNFTSLVSRVFSSMRFLMSSVLVEVCRATSEEIESARLAAISRAAAWTPAIIDRKRFKRMYGYGSKALWCRCGFRGFSDCSKAPEYARNHALN